VSLAYRLNRAIAIQQRRGCWIVTSLRGFEPARWTWREWCLRAPQSTWPNRAAAVADVRRLSR